MMLRQTLRCVVSRYPTYSLYHSSKSIVHSKKIYFSTHGNDDPSSSSFAASSKWRKDQIDKIENKFQPNEETGDDDADETSNRDMTTERNNDNDLNIISSDDELQPMWRDMESRVLKRRTYTIAESGGKVGRRNIRKTEEDVWLEAGMYRESDDAEK
uniref:Uncharacterized protein n=1 Tax=Helicotheca tamesis TaxID=374047 RepID=A0A7S2IA71_9STRA|mmetsp:Transcript_7244/g.9830  ORF Transcript_7244/g.9830 Transcript_7244/m.9830 type:complete len:157 (+) Transcript_7244:249-719(+)|eukprot:CAMPEP_0185725748 /NCGR_PEP_ID=MMETSP1171-20130828/1923_1 /TAXON_ID=374046 /ORGANISM="Helicotheca tamensis, Strain CCMP826" /LENGTH=156 /DNA_ID=CAMNT_0028393943 /DNA_START=252 /DNA_END=722 /DNA_ORIENTATION=-